MPYYEDIVHLCDIPRYHAKHNPNEIAFIYEDNQTTYKEFD
jgi:acyl-CoA synthetase (AMP-forming)/AMP-acid ligase II